MCGQTRFSDLKWFNVKWMSNGKVNDATGGLSVVDGVTQQQWNLKTLAIYMEKVKLVFI